MLLRHSIHKVYFILLAKQYRDRGDSPLKFHIGDRVKVLQPETTDTEQSAATGRIVDIREDRGDKLTGDADDRYLYRVEFPDTDIPTQAVRQRDLKPVDRSDED